MGYFGAMALLKNLQKEYGNRTASEGGRLTYEDLEKLVEGDGQIGPAAEDQSTKDGNQKPELRRSRRKGNGSASGPSFWAKLRTHLQRISPGGVDEQINELQRKNARLANRLESLEDKSWEVRESEEIHRSVSEIFGDIVIHRSVQGQLLFSNGIFGRYFDETCPPPPPNCVVTQGTNDDEQARSSELELDTLRGQRWFRWTDLPVRDPHSGDVAIRSVARDITEQKTSEQKILAALSRAEQANAAKSRFLAMVSHEIRTPLNGIIGMAGLMKDSPLAPDQKNYVEASSSSGDTLLNLIHFSSSSSNLPDSISRIFHVRQSEPPS